MADRLKDKVALVFGAGSVGPGWGNGKATAVLFARNGAKVIAVDANRAAAEETRTIIAGEGGTCNAAVADVTKSDQIHAAVESAMQRYGRIDVLHNNVGITEMGGPVELTEESWHRVVDVNATSVFLTCKHVGSVTSRAVRNASRGLNVLIIRSA